LESGDISIFGKSGYSNVSTLSTFSRFVGAKVKGTSGVSSTLGFVSAFATGLTTAGGLTTGAGGLTTGGASTTGNGGLGSCCAMGGAIRAFGTKSIGFTSSEGGVTTTLVGALVTFASQGAHRLDLTTRTLQLDLLKILNPPRLLPKMPASASWILTKILPPQTIAMANIKRTDFI